MAKKAPTAVPSAWDDDWETLADKSVVEELAIVPEPDSEPAVLTRLERLAKHEEENRRIWQTADNIPQQLQFVVAGSRNNSAVNAGTSTVSPTVIAPAAFRPPVKLLSRRPTPQVVKRRDPVTGLEQETIRDDAAEAIAEATAATQRAETPEQRQRRQQREREEKQRKYEEARAKIFGEPIPTASASHSNGGSVGDRATPPPAIVSLASSRQGSPAPRVGGGHSGYNNNGVASPQQAPSQGRGARGGRLRGNGDGGGFRGSDRGDRGDRRLQGSTTMTTTSPLPPSSDTPTQSSPQPQTQAAIPHRKLFDPYYVPKPCGLSQQQQRRGVPSSTSGSDGSPLPSRTGTPREEDFIVRSPRGPDGSGRGGFGFARRGGGGDS